MSTLNEDMTEFREAWLKFCREVAEAIGLYRFVAWLSQRMER